MYCWHCGAELPLTGKISFRATCEKCHTDLHCCKNCRFFKPGAPNDCAIPGTDYVADREKNNLCEEFKLLGKAPEPKNDSAKQRFNRLFGD